MSTDKFVSADNATPTGAGGGWSIIGGKATVAASLMDMSDTYYVTTEANANLSTGRRNHLNVTNAITNADPAVPNTMGWNIRARRVGDIANTSYIYVAAVTAEGKYSYGLHSTDAGSANQGQVLTTAWAWYRVILTDATWQGSGTSPAGAIWLNCLGPNPTVGQMQVAHISLTTSAYTYAFTQAGAASLTLTGATANDVARSLAGAASLTLTGATAKVRSFARAFGAALSLTGATAKVKAYGRVLGTSLTLTGATAKVTAYVRAFGTSLTLTGAKSSVYTVGYRPPSTSYFFGWMLGPIKESLGSRGISKEKENRKEEPTPSAPPTRFGRRMKF
jgi:hypothetical protein